MRNTRKLMVAAASIMAVYLVSAVVVTTLLVPHAELLPGGAAEHRALAYLAHGSPLADGASGTAVSPLFGEALRRPVRSVERVHSLPGRRERDDGPAKPAAALSQPAGHGSQLGRQSRRHPARAQRDRLVGHGRVPGQSRRSQQWAYATSVLVLLAGAALAAAKDLRPERHARPQTRSCLMALSAGAGGFFLAMTGLTVLINHSGLTIALAFVLAILVSSFVSRWIRSTELRFEGFEFADEASRLRWNELCRSGAKVLVPHRPGLISLAEKCEHLQRDYRLDPATPRHLHRSRAGRPEQFLSKAAHEDRARRRPGSHSRLAMRERFARAGGDLPGTVPRQPMPAGNHLRLVQEPPLAANLNFLLLGEGNIPWMVKELVRKAMPDPTRQPRIRIG